MRLPVVAAVTGFACAAAFRTFAFAPSSTSSSSSSSAPTSHLRHHPVVHCYRSIENAIHFKKEKEQLFSGRFQPYTLGEIIPITHDVALFRFLLPSSDDEFNLKPCSTLQACYKYGVQAAEQVFRFYTPVTANHTKGYFDVIVKRKQGGAMTKHLFGMHIGDKLLFRSVSFKMLYKANKWKQVGMIGGGTGFTPMLQVIRHALTEPLRDEQGNLDQTKLSFLFCNRTEKHILLKGLFDDLAVRFPDRFRMYYTIDQCVDPKSWNGFVGFVTPEMIRETMPSPTEKDSIILVCGPDHLLHHVAGTPMQTMASMSSGLNVQPVAPDLNNLVGLGGVLGSMGYNGDQVYRF